MLELVNQRDVDAAIDVLEQLGHLGDASGRDADGALEDAFVQGCGERGGYLFVPANDLGNVVARDGVVAGIFPLGREGNVKDSALLRFARALDLEAVRIVGFEDWDEHLLGSAGVGGAFEDDQLPFLQPWGGGFGGVLDVAKVGLMVLGERSGNAHDDGVHVCKAREVVGGAKSLLERTLNLRHRYAENVGSTGLKVVHFFGVNVESSDFESCLGKKQREGQTDISESDDSDFGSSRVDAVHSLPGNSRSVFWLIVDM